MKKKLKYFFFIILAGCSFFIGTAQSCETYNFTPPSISSCSYTYTLSGWEDALGNPTSAPNAVNSSTTVCIMADNSDTIAGSGFKGTLYVAPGVTYSGTISSINGATLVIEGNVDFLTNPSFQNATVYIFDTGRISVPGTFNPAGSSVVYNNGDFDIGDELQLGGSTTFVSFNGSKTTVQSDASIASEYSNCGILEVFGSLSSGGSSSLSNNCSVYIHTDMSLNADYTNNGLFVLDGDLSFGTATFYNNSTMLLNNINLSNDDLIGNNQESFLIVRNNANLSSGGSITGHMYYDLDDGGGFDMVCGSCTEDIDVLLDVTIPATTDLILEDCGANIIINPVLFESKLDFDGVDDYLSTEEFINGESEITFMAWVKSDSGNIADITIGGEDTGCKLWLKNGNRPAFTLTTQGNSEITVGACNCNTINYDEWHHITGVYDGSTGEVELYIDGELVDSGNVGSSGALIESTSNSNGNFEVGRQSSDNIVELEYFKGDIDEVRVFDIALTSVQIKQLIYQEILNNSGVVQGAIIPKDIGENDTCSAISWSNLIAYYPMTDVISYDRTSDLSNSNRITKLHNITSFQAQTAPMPYRTGSDGDWTSESTWEHGNVWDIENISSNKEWCIVKIEDDVSTSDSHSMLALLIDSDKTLTVNGNNYIENTWYLELNGALNLMNDSQLIQTNTSDLVTSADGKALRRQEGTPSAFWYNYWSSPVGATGSTSLIDNNSASNNTNNSAYSLNMLKDDTGFNCQFTSEYTANGNISTYWLYTFINGRTYWDWERISITAGLSPGVGYTQKGTGVAGTDQQYIFEGKPNNGTILVNVTDVGGPGSEQDVSKTSYLLGNPYPSALDVHAFIDDNDGVIDGTLHLWQQWSGSSHNLNEYHGGYAQVNKLGATRASQFIGISGANTGGEEGTSIPSRYLPVGQGFVTEIIADGNVEFNNDQRVFVLEEDADGTYNNGSVFFKNTKAKSKASTSTAKTVTREHPFKKVRLEFTTVEGPDTRRELLIGFSQLTTDEYDYGYDAKCDDKNNNDLNLNLDGENMNMQAFGELTTDKVVSLNFKSSGSNTFEIKITDLENIEASDEIYIRDNLTGEYFDMRQGLAYTFSSEQGKFNERLEIVFQSQQQSLSTEEATFEKNFIYYLNGERRIFVKKLSASIKNMALVNMRGQTVMALQNVPDNILNNGIEIPNVSSGGYIAYFRTEDNQVLTKKIVVN